MSIAEIEPPDVDESQAIRLNLGAGDLSLEGFTPIDRKFGGEVYPLDYPDNSVDEIRASHVLEHFSHREVGNVLRDWFRALKPHGVLRVAVPDFAYVAQRYINGEQDNWQGYVMGGHVDDNDHHGVLFDEDVLRRALETIGFHDIRHWMSELADCASLPVSLNLSGTKPGPIPEMAVTCAMSVPRLGFQDNFFTWARALAPLGIKPISYQGAFWGQCLERVMSMLLDQDWILTLDYDTVATKADVERMLRIAASHPEIDALAPMQMRRGTYNHPLLTMKDADGNERAQINTAEFAPELVKVATAHFGMTLIRVEALKKMAHPWFLDVPNEDGEWGEGRTDSDIHFWKKWEEVGNSCYVSCRTVVGHIEAVINWPSRRFQPLYQPTQEFWDKGPPKEVWR